jgi:hypothetical protein
MSSKAPAFTAKGKYGAAYAAFGRIQPGPAHVHALLNFPEYFFPFIVADHAADGIQFILCDWRHVLYPSIVPERS